LLGSGAICFPNNQPLSAWCSTMGPMLGLQWCNTRGRLQLSKSLGQHVTTRLQNGTCLDKR
jgi:hypothetical protein